METTERILEGAEDLFWRYGIRSITMDEIAKSLGISKKTIYQFFKDKEEIVRLVTQRHLTKDVAIITNITIQSENAIDEFMQIAHYLKSTFAHVNPSLLFDLQKYHPLCWNIFLAHKKNFILESISNNLKRGIKDELYRANIQVDILSVLRVEQIQLAFNIHIFHPTQFNFLEIQTQFIEHFIRGILTSQGFKIFEKYIQV